MGGSAKSGGASKRYNYFGTIAGLVCGGKVSKLKGIEVDDEMLWRGSILEADSPNPVEVTVPGRGLVRFYWGRDDQLTQDPALTAAGNSLGHDHPSYNNICYFVAVDFLFGLEKTSAPNIRIHFERTPQQSLITGDAAALADGQANPFAHLAELATSGLLGLASPLSRFSAADWQAAADAAYARASETYVSVLMTEQVNYKSHEREILSLCDGFVRPKATNGTGEAGLFTRPEYIDAESLPLISARNRTDDPDVDDETLDDVFTRVVVTYRDRNKNFKERPAKYDDPSARRIGGRRRTKKVKANHIVRYDQALAYAQKLGSRLSIPGSSGKETVRAETVTSFQPGQHVRIDVDAIPGGTEQRKVCRLVKITRPAEGAAIIEYETERQLDAAIYTPTTPTPSEPPAITIPEVANARFFEAPYQLAGGNAYRIGVLASRPGALVTAYRVHYDDVTGGDFPAIGDSRSYALRGRLNGAYADDATGALNVELLDAYNREIIDDNPGETAARDDALLMLVFKISSGQIAADGEGKAFVEIFSVEEIVSTAPNFVDVTALRSRQGTPARDLPDEAEVWFIRRSALTILEHADFQGLALSEGDAFFKLQASGPEGERPIEDCTERTFTFALAREAPPLFPDDGVDPDPVSSVTITPGLNTIWLNYTLPTNTPLRSIRIYEGLTSTRPSTPAFTVGGSQNFFVREGLASSVTRYYWIEAEGENGRRSSIAGPYSETTINLELELPDGSTVPTVVNSLPATDNFQGRLVYLTTDGKLYRWTHASETTGTTHWTAAVAAADVSGTLADAQIAALAASKITGTLTNSQIADLAATKISGTLSDAQLAAIASTKITGTLTNSQIADLAATKITGTLTNSQIADLAATKISGTLSDAQLAAISAAKITGTLTNSQIADLAATKISGTLSDAQIEAIAATKITGTITTTQITDDAITTAKIAANAITATEINAGAVTAGKIAANAVTATEISAGAITTGKLAAGAVTANEIAANAITAAKIDAGSVTTAKLAAGAVTANEIATNAITSAKIDAGAITTGKLAAGAVTANEIASNAITAGKIDAGAVTTAKLAADAVTANEIAANAITSAKINAGAITTAKIAAGAVTADEIATNAITAVKINAGAITTGKIAADAVTANEIAANAVTAAKIQAGSIETAKLAAGAVVAEKIAAFSITASKLTLVNADSVIRDPGFYDPQSTWGFPSTSFLVAVDAAHTVQPRRFMRLSVGSGAQAAFGGVESIVESGASFRIRIRCYLSPDFVGDFTALVHLNNVAYSAAGIPLSGTVSGYPRWDTAAMTKGAWLEFTEIRGTSGACKFINAIHAWDITAGYIEWAFEVVRAASAELIVDGAITTDKLTANAVTAGKIAAGAIETDKLAANSITAAKIGTNEIITNAANIGNAVITGAKIANATIGDAQVSSLSASKISASSLSAITATIGTLRTASTGARTEIKDNIIEVYDASNVLRVRMGVWS